MSQVRIPTGYVEIIAKSRSVAAPNQQVNVFAAAYDDTASPSVLGAAVGSAVSDLFAAANVNTLLQHVIVRIGSSGPPYASFDLGGGQVGTYAGEPAAGNVSILVTKSSETPGRPGRGRTYLGGFATDADVLATSELDETRRAAMQGVINDFYSALDTPPLLGGVILHPEDSPFASTPSIIIGAQVQALIATQRRRLR